MKLLDLLERRFSLCIHYFIYLKNRAAQDRLAVNSGYLAYITLLSLVPLLTVVMAAISKFPAFTGLGEQLQGFIFENFMPASDEAVRNALNQFIANTSSMTMVGGLFVFITAMLLISTIDKNLNYIWKITEKRRIVHSFSMYWMVLTLGPIFIGTSVALTSYITSEKFLSKDISSHLYTVLPSLFSILAFLGLYLLVPNAKVKFKHACAGAIVAGLLFELSKKAFALYIVTFPSYQLIYGALAAIPILFVWVYLCWFIVLIGAEVTSSLGERDVWYNDEPYHLFVTLKEKLRLRALMKAASDATTLDPKKKSQNTQLENDELKFQETQVNQDYKESQENKNSQERSQP